MEVKKITLNNVGRFSNLEIALAPLKDLDSNVTVLIGNNGSGKTSILQSLAISLSWLVSRIQSEKGNGSPIPELSIQNEKNSASIEILVDDDRKPRHVLDAFNPPMFSWTVSKARKGRKNQFTSNYSGATKLADRYRSQLSTKQHSTSLPLIAFYPVERVVLDIPLKIKDKHTFFQIDGYDKSLSQGVDFRRFFEWFREREDSENESGIPEDMFEKLRSVFGNDEETWAKLSELKVTDRDRQLTAVRSAIHSFMPEFSNLRVQRKPRLHMSVDKNNQSLNVAQLSQGEKSLMALIGDIARRLAIMNPGLENPLQGDGIVLIDEVDMHLHPKWQRSLVNQFSTTFPNCQFVLTTHSPLVISDSKEVLTYMIGDDDELTQLPPLYGEDANSVLLDIMDTNIRNADINTQLNDLLDAIHDSKIAEAKRLMGNLEAVLPSQNIELAKAKLLLRKQELRVAKNH